MTPEDYYWLIDHVADRYDASELPLIYKGIMECAHLNIDPEYWDVCNRMINNRLYPDATDMLHSALNRVGAVRVDSDLYTFGEWEIYTAQIDGSFSISSETCSYHSYYGDLLEVRVVAQSTITIKTKHETFSISTGEEK